MGRVSLVREDLLAYKETVENMRNRKLLFPVFLQAVYPNVPYKGKWVKLSQVMSEIMVDTFYNIPREKTQLSEKNLTEGAKESLQPYLIKQDSMQCIYILSAVQGHPMHISQVEMDSVYGEDGKPLTSIPNHKSRWFELSYDAEDKSYDAVLGYGGYCRPIKGWTNLNIPTAGVRIYHFNIRQFWIFKPDYDSDIYGIINQSVVNIL